MNKINWEERRYEIAKEILGAITPLTLSNTEIGKRFSEMAKEKNVTEEQVACKLTLNIADQMIKQLKESSYEQHSI